MTKKMIKSIFFLFIIFLFLLNNTTVQATIIFTKAGSPYHLTEELTITNQDTLIIEAGAVLILSPAVNILTNGVIMINGSVEDTVHLLPEIAGTGWGKIEINCPGKTSFIQYAVIVDGSILSKYCNMTLDHTIFINNQDIPWTNPIMFVRDASVKITNSTIYGSRHGEGFQMLNSENVLVRNCYFSNIADAVELTNVTGGTIRGNWFEDIPDDAIDLNHCANTLIDSNMIINVENRGMELGSENNGSSENIAVIRNIFVSCNVGVIFKENSYGQVFNNTFYANITGIKCIENNSRAGSFANVQNCIFSNSIEEDVYRDTNSSINLAYCLSDKELLPGTNNIFNDPLFVDTVEYNFNLQKKSPCINAGNPDFPPDPDNSISDIGALYYNMGTSGDSETVDLFRLIRIYPNPFRNSFVIKWLTTNSMELSIRLFDLKGTELPVSISKKHTEHTKTYLITPETKPASDMLIICNVSFGKSSKSYLLLFKQP